MKTKRSVYVVIDKEDKATVCVDRAGLRTTVDSVGVDKIATVYRAVPLEIRTETSIKIGAPKAPQEVKPDGTKDNKKGTNR